MDPMKTYTITCTITLKGSRYRPFLFTADRSGNTLETIMEDILNNHDYSIKDLSEKYKIDFFYDEYSSFLSGFYDAEDEIAERVRNNGKGRT